MPERRRPQGALQRRGHGAADRDRPISARSKRVSPRSGACVEAASDHLRALQGFLSRFLLLTCVELSTDARAMNEIDPARRFSMDAVRKFDGEPVTPAATAATRTTIARQVATQYRRDTMSPVMVSGVLRLVEFGAAVPVRRGALRHLCRPRRRISPGIIRRSSSPARLADRVILLEFTDCYQISALLRPVADSGRLLLIWSGTFAVLALTGFFMKMSSRFFAPVVRHLVRHRLRAAVRAAAGHVAA